ncbi:hypothetical protein ACHAQH_000238 [Verticillium albo-atrum]
MTPVTRIIGIGMSVLAFVASIVTASDGSFVKTCLWNACKFRNNHILGTYCNNDKKDTFGYDWTQIDLGKCVGNNGGTLIDHEDGKFQSSCEKCKLTNNHDDGTQFLVCKCHTTDENGGMRRTKLDLDKVLYNDNGTLGCHDHLGSKFGRPPPEWDPDTDEGKETGGH